MVLRDTAPNNHANENNSEQAHNARPQEFARHQQSEDRGENSPEILFKLISEGFRKLVSQLKTATEFVMVDLGGYQILDNLVKWCVQHPKIAICALAAGLVLCLPMLLLMGFAMSTILMTFTGFLFLEGTLLTILSMLMFGMLGALIIVLLFFAGIALAAYLGFAHIYDLSGSAESHASALKNFLQREYLNAMRRTRIENVETN